MNVRPHYLDVTSVTDREDLTAAFGAIAAWDATIKTLTEREARETDRAKKMRLRLHLLSAHNQLRLAKEGE